MKLHSHTNAIRWIALLLACLCVCFAVACQSDAPENSTVSTTTSTPSTPNTPKDKTSVRLIGLKGPTGMGMTELVSSGSAHFDLKFTLCAKPTDVTPLIVKGDYDIAAVPVNLAPTLYTKTNGALEIIAVNSLGVLYVMENGNTIQSFADLAGKDIYYFGQGSTPEYVLRYLLSKNQVEANLIAVTDQEELVTKLAANQTAIGVLPEPSVTSALLNAQKSENAALRVALNLTAEWDKVADNGSRLVQGCLVVRKGFLESVGAEVIAQFLTEYAASVEYVTSHIDEAAGKMETLGIVPKAAVAKKALTNLGGSICACTGTEMKAMLAPMFTILHTANPASIGGKLPDDSIYFIPAEKAAA